ncbi:hypothetical protein HWV62_4772, partial [Athelia sp. TMB]
RRAYYSAEAARIANDPPNRPPHVQHLNAASNAAEALYSAPHTPLPAAPPQLQAPSATYSAMHDLGPYATRDDHMRYNAAPFEAPIASTDAQHIDPPPTVHTAPYVLAPTVSQHAGSSLRTSRRGIPPPSVPGSHQTMGAQPSLPERGSMEVTQARGKAPKARTSAAPYSVSERSQKPKATSANPASAYPPADRPLYKNPVKAGLPPSNMPADSHSLFVNTFGWESPVASGSHLPSALAAYTSVPPVASGSGLPYQPATSGPPRWGQSGNYEQLVDTASRRFQRPDPYRQRQFLQPRSPRSPPPQ